MHRARSKKPDMVLFDLDGTLWHLPRIFTAMAGVWDKINHTLRNLFGIKPKLQPLSAPTAPEKRGRFVILLERILRPRKIDHADTVLAHLQQRGIAAGIVSNGPRQWGSYLLDKFNLAGHFAAASFRKDGLKPCPQSVLNVIDHIGTEQNIAPKTVWLVGDRASDIRAALNAAARRDYTVVPVAIGAHSKATRTLKKLQRRGRAENGLSFPTYAAMLAYLKP